MKPGFPLIPGIFPDVKYIRRKQIKYLLLTWDFKPARHSGQFSITKRNSKEKGDLKI